MRYIKSIVLIIVLLAVVPRINAVSAQVYKFDAGGVTQPIPAGSTFQIKVMINTASEQIINGDSLINFDPAKVSIDSAATGNFLTYFSATPLGGSTSKYLVSSWEESVAHAKSSATDVLFATLTLTAKVSGSATLTFECTTGTEADSNINRASDASDIIKCDSLTPLTLTIGGSSGATTAPTSPLAATPTTSSGTIPTVTAEPTAALEPTASPTPIPTKTSVPTHTPRPTISELPRSGTVEITFAALGIGLLLTSVGILFIL